MGLTQDDLAENADSLPTYVGSIDRGDIALENNRIHAKALKCCPRDLMPDKF